MKKHFLKRIGRTVSAYTPCLRFSVFYYHSSACLSVGLHDWFSYSLSSNSFSCLNMCLSAIYLIEKKTLSHATETFSRTKISLEFYQNWPSYKMFAGLVEYPPPRVESLSPWFSYLYFAKRNNISFYLKGINWNSVSIKKRLLHYYY